MSENLSEVLAAATEALDEQHHEVLDLTEPVGEVASVDDLGGLGEVALEQLAGGDGVLLSGDLAPVLDVPVELSVEIGRTTMTIGETLAIGPGSIVSLNRAIGEPVDLLVNGKRIARGEVV